MFEMVVDAQGQPLTQTVQRCRQYAEQYSYSAESEGRGGSYTGKHVQRRCEVPEGAPVSATAWSFSTAAHGALDWHAIQTVCDTSDPGMCPGETTALTLGIGAPPDVA